MAPRLVKRYGEYVALAREGDSSSRLPRRPGSNPDRVDRMSALRPASST
jgi:hypothetical protein